ELFEARLSLPVELLLRLAGIADQEIDLRGAIELRCHDDNRLAGSLNDAPGIRAFAAPLESEPESFAGGIDEIPDRMRAPGGEHVVVGLPLLQHHPHALDIFRG